MAYNTIPLLRSGGTEVALELVHGVGLYRLLTLRYKSTKLPKDLTDFTFAANIYNRETNAVVATLDVTIFGTPTNGQLLIVLNDAAVDALSESIPYEWQLRATHSGTTVEWFYGTVTKRRRRGA
jgi:hypothetical protein